MAVSLLWPEGHTPAARSSGAAEWIGDLGVDGLARALAYDSRRPSVTLSLLTSLCREPAVITYRQAVLRDLVECEQLAQELGAVIPSLRELELLGRERAAVDENPLLVVLRRLRELELYIEVLQALGTTLRSHAQHIRSAGLISLGQLVKEELERPELGRLQQELPRLRRAMRHTAAITVGINLDEAGRPIAATLLSLEERPFGKRRSLLARVLFGEGEGEHQPVDLAPLHETSAREGALFLEPLFRDLDRVLRATSRPVAQALTAFAHMSGRFLAPFADELGFYLGAASLFGRLRSAGLPLCWPRLLPEEERTCQMRDLYNINLALRLLQEGPARGMPERPVPSDLMLGQQGRCCVLTGPNLGGKTTFLQAVGLAHVLAQAGLMVPCSEAALSPVDAIYTHFPREERADRGTGRLGEEAQRLAQIFSNATPYSLVLLNETLSSTSPGEAVYLGRELLAASRLLGARTIYATHLHDLAADLAAVDALAPGEPPTVSLVAGVAPAADPAGAMARTFRIEPGPPQGRSFAAEVASAFGISFTKLRQKLQERGLLKG